MAVSVVPCPVMKMIRLLGVELVKVAEDVKPGAVAQTDVEQDHVRDLVGSQLQSLGGGLRTENLNAVFSENLLDAETDARFVVNYQQFCHVRPS